MATPPAAGDQVATAVVAETNAQLPTADVIAGTLPSGLRGTLLRMVPANPEHLSEHPPLHPEDGDGHVVAISFYTADDVPDDVADDDDMAGAAPAADDNVSAGTDGTRVFARNRFVRTAAFNKESKQRRRRYRSRLATPATGGWAANLLSVTAKRSASEYVASHAKTVLAYADRGLPYMIDGGTLVTRGPAVLAGSLSDDTEDLPVGNCVLGRSVYLPGTGGVALLTGRRGSADTLRGGYCVAYDDAFKPEVRSRAFRLTTRLPLRSFGVTDDWFVIPQSSSGARGNSVATAMAGRCDGDVVTWADAAAPAKGGVDASGSVVAFSFVPRGKPDEVTARVIPLTDGAGAVLDVANAYADTTSDGRAVVVVDGVAIRPPQVEGGHTLLELMDHLGQRWADGDAPWPAVLMRYVFDVADDAVLSATPLTDDATTLYTPVVARDASTCRHPAVYANGWDATAQRAVLVRVDTDSLPPLQVDPPAAVTAAAAAATWVAADPAVRVGSPVLTDDGRWVLAPMGGGRLGVWSTEPAAGDRLELVCVLDAGAYGLGDGGVGGAWTGRVWTAEQCATRKKTAYEIFQSKGWNSVDSSFSGLGLNQL